MTEFTPGYLSGHSDIFRTMLTSDMDEVNSGLTKFMDMTPTTFQKILHYIYTGVVADDFDSEDLLGLNLI